jgi:hypothetical protein
VRWFVSAQEHEYASDALKAQKQNATINNLDFFMAQLSSKDRHRTRRFSGGARSAFKLKGKRLLEKHAIAPSAARLC